MSTTPQEKIARLRVNARHRREQLPSGRKDPHEVRAHYADHEQLLATSQDVYAALANARLDQGTPAPLYLSVTSAGWASPADNSDIAPSLHPKRQRVALACVISLETLKIISAIRFAHKRAETNETGEGTLGDELTALAHRVKASAE